MWTLDEARNLIATLQPDLRKMGYHIALAGSVLNVGESAKDLDLWFLPLHGYMSDTVKVLTYLIGVIGPCQALRDSPDYGPDQGWQSKEQQMFLFLNKRIDVFIL